MTALTFTPPAYCRDRAAQSAATQHLTLLAAVFAGAFGTGVAFGIMLAKEFAPWMI